jgi:TonB-dependent starch-binding outer membrane protein SusC
LYYDLDTESPQSILSGNIDFDDAQIAGKALPDYFGGLNNMFSYKKFDALVAFQFSVGNDVYNLIRPTYENMGWGNDGGTASVYANNWVGVKDRWKQPGDKTDMPRASFIYQNYLENSTQYIEDGSFLRLRTFSLGYNFKPKFAGVENVRLYGQVQNMFVITGYKGFDPEVSSTGGGNWQTAGIDYGAYPQPRTITLGINVKF